MTKLKKDPSNPSKLVDVKWVNKRAACIDPSKDNQMSRRIANVKWKRPEDFTNNPKFADKDDGDISMFSANDIKQGQLGDCWLLSAIAVVAGHENLMDRVIVNKKLNPAGYYIIRLFINGKWVNVVVDDKLPSSARGGPIFCSSKNGSEIWMSIVEKAYAKQSGSYEVIEGGHVQIGLSALTGGVGSTIRLEEKGSEIASGELFAQMKQYFSSGYLMGAGSPAGSDTDISDLGIVQGHAYSILNIVEESDQNGNHQLIELRNPWGSGEWTGKWSDRDSRSWTSRMRQRLNYGANQDDNDGTFWMSFQDFCKNYSVVNLCRLFKTVDQGGKWHKATMMADWAGKNAGGCPQPANKNAKYNPQWLLKLSRPGHVFIQLEQTKVGQKAGRLNNDEEVSYIYSNIYILRYF
jgi:hypothetical protein